MIAAFSLADLTGCQVMLEENNITNEVENIQSVETEERATNRNGFSLVEITDFEMARARTLFYENGLTEYEKQGLKRNYFYTSEDYKKILELDESYFYGIYLNTTDSY